MRTNILVFVIASLLPVLATAADFGTITVKDKTTPLTGAIAYVPYFNINADGKPDTVVVLATQGIEAQIPGWIDPSRAMVAAVRKSKGLLLTLEYTQNAVGYISVDGPGLGYEHQGCAKCKGAPTRTAGGLKDHVSGEPDPVGGSSGGITFDAHFDIAKVQTQTLGEPLPADGGAPGKAFVAYAKAYAEGNYDALKTLSMEAVDLWGDEEDAAKRTRAIMEFPRGAPRNALILKGWQNQDSAILIVEGNPANRKDKKYHFGIGLGKTNGQWQVREQILDLTGKIFTD
jgi:hypothetical protein